jgi:hypothetical protein
MFISADMRKEIFVKCVEEIAQERGDTSVFCPTKFRELRDKQLLDKVIRELDSSHLVLMDVSMEKIGENWYPNAGVLVEFGLIVKDLTKGLDFVYMFCDQTTERTQLPPIIPRTEVQKYDESKINELKEFIRQAVHKYEQGVPERLRQALQAKGISQIMYEISKSSTS